MAVLNDVRMFGAVKDGDRTSVALGPNIVVSWVNGHGGDVNTQMTHKHHTCTLISGQESNTRGRVFLVKNIPTASITHHLLGWHAKTGPSLWTSDVSHLSEVFHVHLRPS